MQRGRRVALCWEGMALKCLRAASYLWHLPCAVSQLQARGAASCRQDPHCWRLPVLADAVYLLLPQQTHSGHIGMSTCSGALCREEALRAAGFTDIFRQIKAKENSSALGLLRDVCAELDEHSEQARTHCIAQLQELRTCVPGSPAC